MGKTPFVVEVARTFEEQAQGLSGRDVLALGTGMVFPQRREQVPTFWMRGMRFALDFLWIGEDCRLAEVTPNVPPPAPGTPENQLPIYSPSRPVRYVFEVNAGEAAGHGLRPGDPVRFLGAELADLGCAR